MNELIEHGFNFNGNDITVIIDGNGEPWWVAKEICDILELGNHRTSIAILDDDEKGVHTMDTLGGPQQVTIINEPGLYTLILRSRKEPAKDLKRFITHEVLPSIRKTGSYSLAQKRTPLPSIRDELKAAKEIVEILGLTGNQAILSANRLMKNYHGIDCMNSAQITHLDTESKEIHLTPSDIGKQLGTSGQKANKALELIGLQTCFRNKKNRIVWQPTDKGKEHCVMKDTGKRHSDGTPVVQVFWSGSVIDMLKQQ